MLALRQRLRDRATQHDLTTVIACAFDHRTRMGGVEGSSLAPHEDAIAREVAIYAERCDISEEISRIHSHLEQFDALCSAPEETGRKLDFLTQELLREANTIGSKANNVEIGQATVAIKAAIDRIKEQVQNVE